MDYSTLVLGLDASHYQQSVDFVKARAAGVQFAIIKESEGSREDPEFLTLISAAADAGLITFWYPFVTAEDTPEIVAQALDWSGGCVPALDVETRGIPASVVELWMKSYEDRAGRVGLHYHGFWPVEPISNFQARWPWWLAEYADVPRAPAWDGLSTPDWCASWLIWQFTGSGRIDGCSLLIDLDRCAVSIEVLRRFHDTGNFN